MDTSWIKELFSKESAMSSMRWVLVWTWAFVIVIVFGTWAAICLMSKPMSLVDFPANVVLIVTSVLAIVTGGKAWQNVTENKEKANESPPKP